MRINGYIIIYVLRSKLVNNYYDIYRRIVYQYNYYIKIKRIFR